MRFSNAYDDNERAESYSRLGFPGTYHLAYRDLPELLGEHVRGRGALDFGCGAGRSTRFLKRLGFSVVGVDISHRMIGLAREADPSGEYRHISDGDFSPLQPARFDLVLCAFTFDNIPDVAWRAKLLRRLRDLLRDHGRVVLLGSTPEIYVHEWASFTTREFPENRVARGGDQVRIVMKDVEDARPVVDLIWFHEDYVDLFAATGMEMVARRNPLGREDEGQKWISETSVAPWVIYVLRKAQ